MRAPSALNPTRVCFRAPRAPVRRPPSALSTLTPGRLAAPEPYLSVPPPSAPPLRRRVSQGQRTPPHSPPSAPAPCPPGPRGRSLTLAWFTRPAPLKLLAAAPRLVFPGSRALSQTGTRFWNSPFPCLPTLCPKPSLCPRSWSSSLRSG